MKCSCFLLSLVAMFSFVSCAKTEQDDKGDINELVGTYKGTAVILDIEYKESGNTTDTIFNLTDTGSYVIQKSGDNNLLVPSRYGPADVLPYSGNYYKMKRGWGMQELTFTPDVNKVAINDSACVTIQGSEGKISHRMVTRFIGYK